LPRILTEFPQGFRRELAGESRRSHDRRSTKPAIRKNENIALLELIAKDQQAFILK
jgi:hypothetical protein